MFGGDNEDGKENAMRGCGGVIWVRGERVRPGVSRGKRQWVLTVDGPLGKTQLQSIKVQESTDDSRERDERRADEHRRKRFQWWNNDRILLEVGNGRMGEDLVNPTNHIACTNVCLRCCFSTTKVKTHVLLLASPAFPSGRGDTLHGSSGEPTRTGRAA